MLECPSVMPNQGILLTAILLRNRRAQDADRLWRLEERFDHHRAPGRTPLDTLMKLIKGAGIYANPDIGNFGDRRKNRTRIAPDVPACKDGQPCQMESGKFNFATAIAIRKRWALMGYFRWSPVALSLMLCNNNFSTI